MKYATDFRSNARNALSGRWTTAVVAGLIALLFGAVHYNGPEVNKAPGAAFIILAALAIAIVRFVLGCVVGIGYSRFNLDLVDRQKEPEIGTLFRYLKYWRTAIAANLLQFLYIFLWSLLFIIPGIVAGYSYAMTNFILAEHPELTASEAIEQSKQMMSDNRWRLFCLRFSFLGWDLLCLLTLGIGDLWLRPYKQAAEAAFYREVSVAEYLVPPSDSAPVI